MKEVWVDIKNYEGFYQASNLGRVRSLERSFIDKRGTKQLFKSKVLKQKKRGHGYFSYNLSKEGNVTQHAAHRLIAIAHIPNPENKPQVNHIDGDKSNNHSSNLEWTTISENCIHRFEVLGHKTHNKISSNDIRLIEADYLARATTIPLCKISDIVGVDRNVLNRGGINTSIR